MRTKPPTFNRWYNTRSGDAFKLDPQPFVKHTICQRPEGYTNRELTAFIKAARSVNQSDTTTREAMEKAGVTAATIDEAFAEA